MERPAENATTPPSPHPQPTTFVQADPHTFRDVVQKLTGAAAGDSPDKLPVTTPARPAVGPRRPAFKLQDRRPSVRKLEIKLGLTSLHAQAISPRSPQYLVMKSSFPSPVTPLTSDPLFSPEEEERAAIAEKGFYLHPSPRTTPRGSDPPELLPLFPLTSPKQSKPSVDGAC